MKRFFAFMFALGLTFSMVAPALAAIDVYDFKNPAQEKQFQELTETLRCPKCQNNSIADSNATLAEDMRLKSYELLKEGKTKQQVIDYMIARYGNFVTYDPAVTASTMILWAGPIGFIVIGFSILVYRSRKKTELSKDEPLDDVESERLQGLLAEMAQQDTEATNNQTKVNK